MFKPKYRHLNEAVGEFYALIRGLDVRMPKDPTILEAEDDGDRGFEGMHPDHVVGHALKHKEKADEAEDKYVRQTHAERGVSQHVGFAGQARQPKKHQHKGMIAAARELAMPHHERAHRALGAAADHLERHHGDTHGEAVGILRDLAAHHRETHEGHARHVEGFKRSMDAQKAIQSRWADRVTPGVTYPEGHPKAGQPMKAGDFETSQLTRSAPRFKQDMARQQQRPAEPRVPRGVPARPVPRPAAATGPAEQPAAAKKKRTQGEAIEQTRFRVLAGLDVLPLVPRDPGRVGSTRH